MVRPQVSSLAAVSASAQFYPSHMITNPETEPNHRSSSSSRQQQAATGDFDGRPSDRPPPPARPDIHPLQAHPHTHPNHHPWTRRYKQSHRFKFCIHICLYLNLNLRHCRCRPERPERPESVSQSVCPPTVHHPRYCWARDTSVSASPLTISKYRLIKLPNNWKIFTATTFWIMSWFVLFKKL